MLYHLIKIMKKFIFIISLNLIYYSLYGQIAIEEKLIYEIHDRDLAVSKICVNKYLKNIKWRAKYSLHKKKTKWVYNSIPKDSIIYNFSDSLTVYCYNNLVEKVKVVYDSTREDNTYDIDIYKKRLYSIVFIDNQKLILDIYIWELRDKEKNYWICKDLKRRMVFVNY